MAICPKCKGTNNVEIAAGYCVWCGAYVRFSGAGKEVTIKIPYTQKTPKTIGQKISKFSHDARLK